MTDIRIRKYRPEDREAVIELVRELQVAEGEVYDRMKPPEEIGDWYLDGLLESCDEQKGQLFLADEAGVSVGYAVVLAEVPSEDSNPDEVDYLYAYISDLVVSERLRGRGIGKLLLQKCESYARQHDAKWIRVGVLVNNGRAVSAYENAGFIPLTMEMEKKLQ